ncbi:MAG: hypothetical protein ACR2QF_02580 [Geminicoccaceae bacterium]
MSKKRTTVWTDDEFDRMVLEWRKTEPDLPGPSEAIRRMVKAEYLRRMEERNSDQRNSTS